MKGLMQEIDDSRMSDNGGQGTPLDDIISRVDSYIKHPKLVTPDTLMELRNELSDLKNYMDQEESQEGDMLPHTENNFSPDSFTGQKKDGVPVSDRTAEMSRRHHMENYRFNMRHANEHMKQAQEDKTKIERDGVPQGGLDKKPGLAILIGVGRKPAKGDTKNA